MDSFRVDVVMLRDGVPILDSETALLLEHIDETGSISAAAKRLGLSYSKAWTKIAKAERALGVKLVELKRGRAGGARLTEEGKLLLSRYLEFVNRRLGGLGPGDFCDFVYAGSSDIFIEELLRRLKEEGFCVEIKWVGSMMGLVMTSLGLADIAGIHLLDPSSGEYNTPYLERLGLSQSVVLYRGYMRSIGFAFRHDVDFKGLEDLLRYRLIARNPGSGTRILLESLIDRLAAKTGASRAFVVNKIRGYDTSANTHQEVASAILRGDADVGLTIAAIAERFGLVYRHIALERFDIAANKNSLRKPAVRRLLELLKREKPPEGYTPLRGAGERVLI